MGHVEWLCTGPKMQKREPGFPTPQFFLPKLLRRKNRLVKPQIALM
jgi:hypothetical protein